MPEPSQQDLETAQSLLAMFDQQSEDGEYLFTDADVRHFLPLVLLQLGDSIAPDALDTGAQELLGQLAVAAGIDEKTPPEEVSAKVAGFYERNPPNPTLVEAFQRFVREHIADEASGAAVSKAVTQLLGQDASKRPLESGGPRPPGSVGGGLLARLGAAKALDENKAGDDEG